MSTVEDDMKFSEAYLSQVTIILKENAKHIVNVAVASHEDDVLRATDIIIEVKGGTVAVRLRRESKYRDWTIRSWRAFGVKTELEKLKEGFAKWYLYGWTVDGIIRSWVLIDLDRVRTQGILGMKWAEKTNIDRVTSFMIIPIKELKKYGCIIASQEEIKSLVGENE